MEDREFRYLIINEIVAALRRVRKYSGKFARDELDYAAALLGEKLDDP